MRRLVGATVVVLLTLIGIILLWELRLALALFLFSLAMAATIRPLTEWWASRGLPRGLAVILAYLIVLVLLGGLLALVGRWVLLEVRDLSDSFANRYEEIVQEWPGGTRFQQAVADQLPEPARLYSAIAGERGAALLQNILGIASSFALVIGQIAIVLVLSIYWTIDRLHFERLWLSLLPARDRNRARNLWRALEANVGAYFRSELVQSLLAGVLLGVGYELMGLPYPIFTAISGALLWLIPWLGAFFAPLLTFLIGLTVNPALAVAGAFYTLLVLVALQRVVEPRLFDRRRFSSLLVIILMVALADAWGVFGLLVAPPMAAGIQILFTGLLQKPAGTSPAGPQADLAALQARLVQLQSQVAAGEEASPEMANLLERLAGVIQEAGAYFDQDPQRPHLDLPAAREEA